MFKHQGDVPLYPYSGETNGKLIAEGSYILAYGEVTGHKHKITTEHEKDLLVFQMPNGDIILNLTAPGTITHEEHLKIVLVPGVYRVGKEREYDHFADIQRQVVD